MTNPLDEMSVESYIEMQINEKQDELKGARSHLYDTMNSIERLEKELLGLVSDKLLRCRVIAALNEVKK